MVKCKDLEGVVFLQCVTPPSVTTSHLLILLVYRKNLLSKYFKMDVQHESVIACAVIQSVEFRGRLWVSVRPNASEKNCLLSIKITSIGVIRLWYKASKQS